MDASALRADSTLSPTLELTDSWTKLIILSLFNWELPFALPARLEERCDLNIDCPDSSDEMNCTFLEKPSWYLTGILLDTNHIMNA